MPISLTLGGLMAKTVQWKSMGKIEIFTDGSSLGNPGPGGFAALIRIGQKEIIVKGGEPHTTNNRMEMRAVIEAFERMPLSEYELRGVPIHVSIDSRLVVETMRKGWKKKENLDLWKKLESLCRGKTIEWHWVKGHASHPENNRVDALANKEAEKMAKKKIGIAKSLSLPFFCNTCQKAVKGKLRTLESGLIRADCEHCGKFIKFAKHTKETLQRAENLQKHLLGTSEK